MTSPLTKSFLKMDLGHGLRGPLGVVTETGLELATGAGVGYCYQKYRGKWYGDHAATLATVVGKGLAVVSSLFLGGEANMLTGALNTVGGAGATLKGLEFGLEHARSKENVRAIIVAKDAKLAPELRAKEVTTVGALPPAPPGRTMDWDLVDRMSAMR